MSGSGDSRTRILEATARLAAELGYDATTISRVVDVSGLPASSVYWFFDDKDALYAEAMSHAFTTWMLTQAPRDPLEPGVDLLEGVRRIMRPALAALLDPPDYLRMGTMLLLEEQHTEAGARHRYLEIRSGIEGLIDVWFTRELDPRILKTSPDLPRQLAKLIPAYFDGVFLSRQANLEWDIDRALEAFLVLVETAIAKVSGGEPHAT